VTSDVAASGAARWFLFVGALNAFVVVAAGAYGAHALKGEATNEQFALFQTAVQYHLFHSLGLLVVGTVLRWRRSAAFMWAGALMLVGIAAFCGSLYVAALTGYRLGVAPLGGTAFMAAWLTFAVAALRS